MQDDRICLCLEKSHVEGKRCGCLAFGVYLAYNVAENIAMEYGGNVDYDIIRCVKEAVNIPVIGNGDIKTKEDAKRMLEETGCDAVMIGRGVLGNPWLIKNTVLYLDTGRYNNEITLKIFLIHKIKLFIIVLL